MPTGCFSKLATGLGEVHWAEAGKETTGVLRTGTIRSGRSIECGIVRNLAVGLVDVVWRVLYLSLTACFAQLFVDQATN